MGSSGGDTPSKSPKPSAMSQEHTPAAAPSSTTPAMPIYPEWPGFQAYPHIPPHGFFHSPVASTPQAHPYIWGAQPMMSPYGAPPPPYVMYPPGGIYAHPTVPPGAHPFSAYALPTPNGNADPSVAAGAETDGKLSEGKDRSPIKGSKGSLGSLNMITGKNNEVGATSGALANGAVSQSGESDSESSSEGSDANSQNDSQPKTSGGEEPIGEVHSSQNGMRRTPSTAMLNQNVATGSVPATAAVVTGPPTNLNIGIDYWTNPSSTALLNTVTPSSVPLAVVPQEQWIQDERELKRQKRKQSNRESARRSRLRKQAECEELALRAEALREENSTLRAELDQIKKEYEELLLKNRSLKEKLGDAHPNIDDSGFDKKEKNIGAGISEKETK